MNLERDSHPRELLSPYLDGELPEQARSGVEVHLQGCVACRAIVEDLKALAMAASAEAPPPVPGDLSARIRVALETPLVSGRARFQWWVGWHRLGLAAAGVILILGLWVMRGEIAPPGAPGLGESVRSNPPEVQNRTAVAVPKEPAAQAPQVPGISSRPDESVGDLQKRDEPGRGERTEPSKEVSRKAAQESASKIGSAKPQFAPPPQSIDQPRTLSMSGAEKKDRAVPLAMGAPQATAARTLLLDLKAYRIAVTEQGIFTLSAEGYSCSVRSEGGSVDPDIAALFNLASSTDSGAPGPAAAGQSGGGGTTLRSMEAPAEAEGSAAERAVVVSAGGEIEARLKTLLRSRYLALMEARCGPAPRTVHAEHD